MKAVRVCRERKKLFAALICALVLFAIISPVITAVSLAVYLPPVYNETFLGELYEKYKLLSNTEEEKIVVIGGSSAAFGLDSAMISEHLSMEVVNFGLYANLGTKLMMDLSKSSIGEGDIVVIAPELNAQTLSLYFNGETVCQALDGGFEMMKDISFDDYGSLLGALFGFTSSKLGYLSSGDLPITDGAYAKENFNEYGDNVFDRPYNVMSNTQKNISFGYTYDKDDAEYTDYEKFIDYVREYAKFCRSRGADVLFSFAPMNEAALAESATAESIYSFYDDLASALGDDVTLISNVNDYIMDEGYFFDSEFHLNNSGVVVRTVRLIDDIKRFLGRTDVTMMPSKLPPPPGYALLDFVGGSEENLYFTLESAKTPSGDDVYYVVGLNEEGKRQSQIVIPNNIDDIPVIGVKARFCDGAEVRRVYIGENVEFVSSGAFGGAEYLTEVYFMREDAREVSVPNSFDENGMMTLGANPDILIFVKNEYFSRCKEDYFWGDYSVYLRGY